MLKSLFVKNYALIDEVSVHFDQGLNIITGETGAGKSIIIGALGLILGERASADSIRRDTAKAIVEACFDVSENSFIRKRLQEEGYDLSEELILRREVSLKGTSRTFVNDSPAPLTFLKELGEHLVDLHGQHDHQSLLRPETHVGFLDDAAGLEKELTAYQEAFQNLLAATAELRELRTQETQLREKKAFLEYQLREIDAVDPKPAEDIEIQQELKIAENAERIAANISELERVLNEGDASLYSLLLKTRQSLEFLASIDDRFSEYLAECQSASVIVNEISNFVTAYVGSVEFSPVRTEEMRERLAKLAGIRKKFGGTLDAVLEARTRFTDQIALSDSFDERIATLESEVGASRARAGKLAQVLSSARTKAAVGIEKSVEATLKQLGIEKGRFTIEIARRETSDDSGNSVKIGNTFFAASTVGIDRVEFNISTNAGEKPRPLARVASGGEISRVMLALKTILARSSRLPVLVFDEIDTGISGRIASKVGAAMQRLGENHQIIAITHLPQIAAMSKGHFVVEKVVLKDRTSTTLRRLTSDEHTTEIARLMSGETVTESSLQMARELIGA